MIKEKFLKFLYWIKEHFRFLLEVVVRLSVGIREAEKQSSHRKEDQNDDL